MVTVLVKCQYCGSTEVICHGKSRTNVQRYKCKQCTKTFQLEYKNKACKLGTHEQIFKMSMNSSGTRDTARVLGISKNTVARVLKKTVNIVSCVNTEYIEKTPLTQICQDYTGIWVGMTQRQTDLKTNLQNAHREIDFGLF